MCGSEAWSYCFHCSFLARMISYGVLYNLPRKIFSGVTIDNKNVKPQIGKVYDLTKYGTDLIDQRMGYVLGIIVTSQQRVLNAHHFLLSGNT